MFKITRQDLRNKSNSQLSGLFNKASMALKRSNRLSKAFMAAQSALKTISDELSRRKPSP